MLHLSYAIWCAERENDTKDKLRIFLYRCVSYLAPINDKRNNIDEDTFNDFFNIFLLYDKWNEWLILHKIIEVC